VDGGERMPVVLLVLEPVMPDGACFSAGPPACDRPASGAVESSLPYLLSWVGSGQS